jgi:homoserine O-succinyltransferase/O-acetyltransferase
MSVILDDRSRRRTQADGLVIGLVNNMPDAALEATERQFIALLDSASGSSPVHLRLFAIPEVARGPSGRERLQRLYTDVGELWDSSVDGLIVTGAEPIAADLTEEPYWATLTEIARWAEDGGVPVVWSCLAAHAAVLHLAGIRRHRRDAKCSGVFVCERATAHPLTGGLPAQFRLPHSRYNDLSESELAAADFTVLTRSADAGVDMFARDERAPFLFVQGHPEYDAHTLLREYRRDIRRFLRGQARTYPPMPSGYFDSEATAEFIQFRDRALGGGSTAALERLWSEIPDPVVLNVWRPVATRLYRNWLSLITARKSAHAAAVFDFGVEHGAGGFR